MSNRPCSIHHFFWRGKACSWAGETYGCFCLQSCQDHSQRFDGVWSKKTDDWTSLASPNASGDASIPGWEEFICRKAWQVFTLSLLCSVRCICCTHHVYSFVFCCVVDFIHRWYLFRSFSILFFLFFRLAVEAVCMICMWGNGTTGWRRQERSRTTRPTSCWWRAPVERVICVPFFSKKWRKDSLCHQIEHCIPDFAVLLQVRENLLSWIGHWEMISIYTMQNWRFQSGPTRGMMTERLEARVSLVGDLSWQPCRRKILTGNNGRRFRCFKIIACRMAWILDRSKYFISFPGQFFVTLLGWLNDPFKR